MLRFKRRDFIKLGTASGMLAAGPAFAVENLWQSSSFEVQDNEAAPIYSKGDRLLADTTINTFSGQGVYLYPAWGSPRPYLLTTDNSENSDMSRFLEFRNPSTGKLLWRQRMSLKGEFAARVVGHVKAAAKSSELRFSGLYPPLSVPAMPVLADFSHQTDFISSLLRSNT